MANQNSKSQWRTTVLLKSGINLGPCINWTGGQKTSSPGTAYDDTGGDPVAAPATRSDGTGTFAYTPAIHVLKKSLEEAVGQGSNSANAATVTRVPTADDGSEFPGGAYSMGGFVKEVGEPEQDMSSGDQSTVDIIFALRAALVTAPTA